MAAPERESPSRTIDHAGEQARIAELSRRLLAADPLAMADAIRDSLPLAAEIAGADRVGLLVFSPGPPPLRAAFQWERPGTPGQAQSLDAASIRGFEWVMGRLAGGERIQVTGPQDLPDEAGAEREAFLRRGVAAALALPVCSPAGVVGYQHFERVRPEAGGWSEQEIVQLGLVGDLFAGAIERMRSEAEIERRRAAEGRVAALAQRLLELPSERIDDGIREALAAASELAAADRGCLYAFARDTVQSPAFFEWCAPGVGSHAPRATPWVRSMVLAGRAFQLEPGELPPEAAPEREAMQSRGVRVVLGIPVLAGERPIGFLAFERTREDRKWSEQDVTMLGMIGNLFTAVLRRKRVEQDLGESRTQLLHAQKLEAVGRLAGGVAHDFNNILTVILGYCGPLLARLGENDPARADVAEIRNTAQRATAITRQLLLFSRRRSSVRELVDPTLCLSGLERLLAQLLGEDVELVLELEDEPGLVEIDPHQLEQVVMNLAVNARDAMPDGGTLRLAVRRREVGPEEARRIGLTRPGACVVLTLSDSGCGMDADVRARIFDPFFTTKEPGKGTGLGLSITAGIVAEAGGAIGVRAERGKGSTFEIHLPCAGGVAPAAIAGPRAAEVRSGGECVLLVEDEPGVRHVLRRILEQGGYRVVEAENGEQALQLAGGRAGAFDALVTDVVMPRLSGLELARRLREERPGLPVLFLSGHPERGGRAAEELRADGRLLTKPFCDEDLLAALREALEA